MDEMSEQAKAAKRAYYKEWRSRNKDKIKERNRRYWERRAIREQEAKKLEETEN